MEGCAITGVGVTAFGRFQDNSLKELATSAIAEAIADAGIDPEEIEMAFVANTLSAATTNQIAVVGQVVMSAAGIHGIPVYNVENACAGSSTALNLATHAVRAGAAGVVLVVGVEKMFAADRATTFRGLNGAADADWVASTGIDPSRESVFVRCVYADRLKRYAERTPISPETLAQIAVKNREHAAGNPRAQFREPITVDDVLAAPEVVSPITSLMCSRLSDGASAAVIASTSRVRVVTARSGFEAPV